MATRMLTLDDVKGLISNDVRAFAGATVTVAEAGPYLEQYYLTTPRYNYGGQTGMFWEKVAEHADALRNSNGQWPWPPITVSGDRLEDGHHRSIAAMLVEWEGPIPAQVW